MTHHVRPTLVVSDSESRCSVCGDRSWTNATHDIVPAGLSLQPVVPGCGVAYEAVAGDADQLAEPRWLADELGLPYAGRMPYPTPTRA